MTRAETVAVNRFRVWQGRPGYEYANAINEARRAAFIEGAEWAAKTSYTPPWRAELVTGEATP